MERTHAAAFLRPYQQMCRQLDALFDQQLSVHSARNQVSLADTNCSPPPFYPRRAGATTGPPAKRGYHSLLACASATSALFQASSDGLPQSDALNFCHGAMNSAWGSVRPSHTHHRPRGVTAASSVHARHHLGWQHPTNSRKAGSQTMLLIPRDLTPSQIFPIDILGCQARQGEISNNHFLGLLYHMFVSIQINEYKHLLPANNLPQSLLIVQVGSFIIFFFLNTFHQRLLSYNSYHIKDKP